MVQQNMSHVFSSSLLDQNNITVKQAVTSGEKWNAASFKVGSVHYRVKIIQLY